ncbi:hypothetical protein D7D25_04740 [Proteiniphilum sp. X52]|nr:hypothetical protein D7D25_04740 [Proteiniphilum sp. X52]
MADAKRFLPKYKSKRHRNIISSSRIILWLIYYFCTVATTRNPDKNFMDNYGDQNNRVKEYDYTQKKQ